MSNYTEYNNGSNYTEYNNGMVSIVLLGIFAILVLFIGPSIVSDENMDSNFSREWIYAHDFNKSKCKLDIERK